MRNTVDRLRREVDYLLVDTAASFGELSLEALDVADAVCLVVAPKVPALKALPVAA